MITRWQDPLDPTSVIFYSTWRWSGYAINLMTLFSTRKKMSTSSSTLRFELTYPSFKCFALYILTWWMLVGVWILATLYQAKVWQSERWLAILLVISSRYMKLSLCICLSFQRSTHGETTAHKRIVRQTGCLVNMNTATQSKMYQYEQWSNMRAHPASAQNTHTHLRPKATTKTKEATCPYSHRHTEDTQPQADFQAFPNLSS
jgi:hypothetical protein